MRELHTNGQIHPDVTYANDFAHIVSYNNDNATKLLLGVEPLSVRTHMIWTPQINDPSFGKYILPTIYCKHILR